MDASVTILAGAIATLGEASGGTYHKPASFDRLCSLAECSKTPNTGQLLAAAQGPSMAVCPEEFTTQFRSNLTNAVGDFAGNGLIQGIFRLVDDWARHTETINAVAADAHAAVTAITTMGQEAEHSCEQMATQAANSVDKVCAALGGVDSANNPHQFMKLVALGGAAIDHAITGSCGVYEQRNCGIDKVLHGHVNTLDQLHDSAATRPASVEMGSISKAGYHDGHDIGEVPDMGQMVAELRAEVRLGLQAGLEAGLQQAHQAFGGFEPDPTTPMHDTGVITVQSVPTTPDTSGVDAGEMITASGDGGGQETELHEAPVPEAVPEAIPDPPPALIPEAVPEVAPAPIPEVAPEVVPDPPQAVTPIEAQQCVPPAPPPQEPPPTPPVGFQPHKAGAWS